MNGSSCDGIAIAYSPTLIGIQFVGDFVRAADEQRVYAIDRARGRIHPLPWAVIEYGAAQYRAHTLATLAPAQARAQRERALDIERSAQEKVAESAIAALREGTAELLVQLCSPGGSCTTMQTAIDCMEGVAQSRRPVLTVGKHSICSAAAEVFCHGTERWIEAPLEAMWHGRTSGREKRAELRGIAEYDWSNTLPMLLKHSHPTCHPTLRRAVDLARQDRKNAQMDVYFTDEFLVESGLATQAFPHGSALWQALNGRYGLGGVLRQRQSQHPLRAFCNTPGADLLKQTSAQAS